VAPSSINAERWEWMKRYRVWEANRKIFLWPENWLEPEFRDDKTHLFAELESALQESDLDRDAVEAALHKYLTGLEEIARLDIRAIYREQRPAGDMLHVLARTRTAPHNYFYRTWSHRAWTPWLPVTTDIESDHVVLVVWRGRVHLFWVQFVPQGAEPDTAGVSRDKSAANVTVGEFTAMKPSKKVDVLLYWTSLLQGEWSDPVLAEADEPLTKTVDQNFRPRSVFVWGDVIDGGVVSISLLGQGIDQSFRIRSPYAAPNQSTSKRVPLSPPYLTGTSEQPLTRVGQGRWRGQSPKFAVHLQGHTVVDGSTAPCDMTQDILAKVPTNYHLVIIPPPAQGPATKSKGKGAQAADHPANRPDDPFFLLERDDSFYVEPEWFEFTIPQAHQAAVAATPVWHEFDRVEYWRDREIVPAFPIPPDDRIGVDNFFDTAPVEASVDVVMRPEAVIAFEGRPIGPAGSVEVNAADLLRTGPHGGLIRTDVLLTESGMGLGERIAEPSEGS
jgi:hypothetical protein